MIFPTDTTPRKRGRQRTQGQLITSHVLPYATVSLWAIVPTCFDLLSLLWITVEDGIPTPHEFQSDWCFIPLAIHGITADRLQYSALILRGYLALLNLSSRNGCLFVTSTGNHPVDHLGQSILYMLLSSKQNTDKPRPSPMNAVTRYLASARHPT
jgi:hypothetical protein